MPEGNREQDGADGRILLGQIRGVYGVKGWVKVFSYTDPKENILQYRHWQLKLNGQWQSREIAAARPQGKSLVAKLEGCDDRDAALLLNGADVAVWRSEMPAAAEGEYYWLDLIGLEVVNLENEVLGRLDSLFETGADDVMVVKDERGETLIPFAQPQVVKKVDLTAGRITVDWQREY